MIERKYMLILGITMELVALELSLIYAGSWLDSKYGWPGYGQIAGAFLGLMIWIFHLFIALKSLEGGADQ